LNIVFGNAAADRRGVRIGAGDLSKAVTFADQEARDLRLPAAQVTTDRGDPTDDASLEPKPNGGRINMGAFGNTDWAEPSSSSSAAEPASSDPQSSGCRISPVTPTTGWPMFVVLGALAVAHGRRRLAALRARSG
jgi:hypothetical protein